MKNRAKCALRLLLVLLPSFSSAAYALTQKTGRPMDSWEFLRRVASAKEPEAPGAVFTEIASRP